MSVNVPQVNGETIFQNAIESRNIEMLSAVVNNPDPNNRPDLRIRYTKNITGWTGFNIYELILLERVMVRSFDPDAPIGVDIVKLKDRLNVDSNQLQRLKIVLEIETDKAALRDETREILLHLKSSRFLDKPSVQDSIRLIESALDHESLNRTALEKGLFRTANSRQSLEVLVQSNFRYVHVHSLSRQSILAVTSMSCDHIAVFSRHNIKCLDTRLRFVAWLSEFTLQY